MRYLTVEEVLRLHARLIAFTPPDVPRHAGVRHRGAVQSALARAAWGPFQVGDLPERAAFLLRGIAEEHPFEDGNKRTAYVAASHFLRANGLALVAGPAEAERFMLEVAQGQLEVVEIAAWIRARSEPISPHRGNDLAMTAATPPKARKPREATFDEVLDEVIHDNKELLDRLARK